MSAKGPWRWGPGVRAEVAHGAALRRVCPFQTIMLPVGHLVVLASRSPSLGPGSVLSHLPEVLGGAFSSWPSPWCRHCRPCYPRLQALVHVL